MDNARSRAASAPPQLPHNAIRDHVLMAYPTPILVYPWPDSEALNAELRALIVASAAAESGISRSNIGGWHSATDFLGRDVPCLRGLMSRIEVVMVELTRCFLSPHGEPRTMRFQVEGWANLMRHGAYHNVHNHGNAHWSGVYYVTDNPPVPERPMSGKLEFLDPRAAATMLLLEDVVIYGRQLLDPRAGTTVVFPSWLQHQVHPYFGDGERIAVSFNVVVSPAAPVSALRAEAKAQRAEPGTRDQTVWSEP